MSTSSGMPPRSSHGYRRSCRRIRIRDLTQCTATVESERDTTGSTESIFLMLKIRCSMGAAHVFFPCSAVCIAVSDLIKKQQHRYGTTLIHYTAVYIHCSCKSLY